MEHARRRYRAVVAYDGTDFWGFQLQARERTVQGEIEKALNRLTGSPIRIDAAGRTDAGVHATGQVIAFNAVWKHSLPDLHRALNAVLPDDIVVQRLEIASATFHPRFDALSRTYQYQIINQPWPDVLLRRYAWHIAKPLDGTAMQRAASYLVGEHDFASFGKPPQGQNTVRRVLRADWSTENTRLTFTITANAFLYRMVRNIVGTLVQAGMGLMEPEAVQQILAERDLKKSAPPAPAHGLCLVQVTYPEEA